MLQKNLGKQLWELLSPVVVHSVVTFLVQMIIVGGYYVMHLEEIAVLTGTQEEVMNQAMEILYGVLEYSLEIASFSSLFSIPFLLFMMKRDKSKEIAAGIVPNKKASLSKYVWIAGISIPFALGLNNLIIFMDLAKYSKAYQEAAESFYEPSYLMQLICFGIISPIVEELMFRGLIFKRMRRSTMTRNQAIIISGLLFGFYHGNLVQMIYGSLAGILLAYLLEKYGSMKAPIFAHILMNIVALTLTEADVFIWMFRDTLRMGIITVACAAVASTMFLLIQKIDEKPLQCEEK